MNTDRRIRLWRLVVEHARGEAVTIETVCTVMLTETQLDGFAVTVTLDAGARETLYASDQVASELAELDLTLGEGPGHEASADGPVLVADLATAQSLSRWPALAPAAAVLGVQAAFALPMHVGGVRLGVIDLYRRLPGPLSREQVENALILADTACALLIDSAHGAFPSRDGQEPEQARLQHPEVHQATGMIIAQLGVTAAVALVRLRAYAYANDRRLRDVSRDVVARRLRFHSDERDDDG